MNINVRQDRFALLIVKGETQSKAYELAGYSCTNPAIVAARASALVRNSKVAERIAQLRSRQAEKHEISLDFITDHLIKAAELSVACKQPAAYVSAIVALGRFHGFMVDKSEVTVSHRPAPLPTKVLELSEEDWLRQFSRASERLKTVSDQR